MVSVSKVVTDLPVSAEFLILDGVTTIFSSWLDSADNAVVAEKVKKKIKNKKNRGINKVYHETGNCQPMPYYWFTIYEVAAMPFLRASSNKSTARFISFSVM